MHLFSDKITDEDFEQRIEECIKSRLIPHITIDDEMEQMWSEITVQVNTFIKISNVFLK